MPGSRNLRDLVESPSLKQLVQRVRLRFHLGPLDRRETREYIEHRLAVVGRDYDDLFNEHCFDLIHQYSGGVPRLINTLCDTALLCAYADEKTVIEQGDIQAAAEELSWKTPVASTGSHEAMMPSQRRVPSDTHVTQVSLHSNGELVGEYTFPIGRVILGRSQDNEIYIKSKFVSRHHAQLVSDEHGCVIEDLNSTNGVFLGEKQVKKYRLRDGDSVTLGVHDLVYHDLRLDLDADDDAVVEDDNEEDDSLEDDDLLEDQDSAVNEQ